MTNIRHPDAERVFECHAELLAYTNRQLAVVDGVTDASEVRRSSPQQVQRLRDALYDAPGLIRGFIWENPAEFGEDDRKLVASWRAFERGRFLVRRFTSGYAEFLQLASPHRLFAVNSLHESFKRMGVDPPQVVSGVLLPYGDRIVSDGHLQADALVTDSMNRGFDEEVELARDRYGLIDQLPAAREPTQSEFRYENGDAPVAARQQLDDSYRGAIHGDAGAAYQLIARYEQAVRAGHVDPDATTRFEEYYYDRATSGLDTVALTEGWPFLTDLMGAYDPQEADVSLAVAAIGNAVACYLIRTRQTATVGDIPTSAIEYLLACADAAPETKAWYESTTVGWAIGHPDVSLAESIRGALADGRGEWAGAVLRHAFHADQQAAADLLAELSTNERLVDAAAEFVDDLSRPNAWPPGPTGSWWEEFAYTFEWDESIEAQVRELIRGDTRRGSRGEDDDEL